MGAEEARARGVALYRRRDFAAAAASFTSALEQTPEHEQCAQAELLGNRAAVLLEWRHFLAAQADCGQALTLLASLPRPLDEQEGNCQALASLRDRLTSRAEKIEVARVEAAESADSAARLTAENTTVQVVDVVRAFDDALARADCGPDDVACSARARLLCGRSTALARAGDFAMALQDARQALAEDPRNSENLGGLAAVARLEALVGARRSDGGSLAVPGVPSTADVPVPAVRVRRLLVSRTAGIEVQVREPFIAGTGGRSWQAGHVLAHWLVQGKGAQEALPLLLGRAGRLLELGAGLGLVGLAAAKAGASCVVLSDVDEEVLQNLRCECELNEAAVHVARLDYTMPVQAQLTSQLQGVMRADFRPEHSFLDTDIRFDVVVGADIIYSGHLHAQLARALPTLLRPGGMVVICVAEDRVGLEEFVTLCKDQGLDVSASTLSESELTALRADTEDDSLCEERRHSILIIRR
ncbi:unnamed protein product [Polarella glacialis]|uniref:Calmodulin-lysine N-methyltransferase n=1 Tax=Polarella glacialis TaxID=89957 RepID=A0A813HNP4_POLGL|nr:unnamed protein product [Polarella glacialis]